MLGKVESRRRRGRQRTWYHRLNGHEFEQAPGVGDGQGSLVCCSPWGRKQSDMTERLNWTELRVEVSVSIPFVPTSCHQRSFNRALSTQHRPQLPSKHIHHCVCVYVCVLAAQLCLICDPLDCSPPGSSIHGILQARTLEWVAMPSSRGSSQPKDWTWVSCIAGGFFTLYPLTIIISSNWGAPISWSTIKLEVGEIKSRTSYFKLVI